MRDKALTDLIRISNITGKNPTLVQGGGGNTSVKTDDGKYMYIKASGTALKDMSTARGWRRLRLEAALSIITDKSLTKLDVQQRETQVVNRLLLACDDKVKDDARPSVESHLHALLDKCVIHLHPLAVAAYVNAKNGKQKLQQLFAQETPPPLWVPYADLGFALAQKIARLVAGYKRLYGRKPNILFLEKHGVVVSANTAEPALRLVHKVIRLCNSKLKKPKVRKAMSPTLQDVRIVRSAIRKAVFEITGEYQPVSYFGLTEPVAAFMRRKDAAKLLATAALNPYEQLYANGSAMWVEYADAETITKKLINRIRKGQKTAAAFLVKDVGLFVAADKKIAPLIAEITTGSLTVRMHAAKFGGVVAMTPRQQEFINNWEPDAFRKKPGKRR